MVKIKTIYDLNKKILTIAEIQDYFKIDSYPKLVELVKRLVADGALQEVKASKSNGMLPPLYNKYRVNPKVQDLSYLVDEINYSFPSSFSRGYYLNNLVKYQADKENIRRLAHYFRNHKSELIVPMAINERSFEIWGQEKYLKDGGGQSILKNLGLSLVDLNIYITPEPFVYFSNSKMRKQKVLIIENKDTWYTLRKLMINGQTIFLGQPIDTIIYGSGKNIERSLEDYEHTVEDYLLNPAQVLYWGDIDYEGIAIYERLKNRYARKFNIELFKNAYIAMLKQKEGKELPRYSDKQNKNTKGIFLQELLTYSEKIAHLLQKGSYIPQEIINYGLLREE